MKLFLPAYMTLIVTSLPCGRHRRHVTALGKYKYCRCSFRLLQAVLVEGSCMLNSLQFSTVTISDKVPDNGQISI
jgi:hypothetical protein